MRVIVTRPAAQAAEWVERLGAAGLDAVALPLIGVEPLADRSALDVAWRRLGRYALVVFVSPNAVLRFFDARPSGACWPAGTLAGAPGPGTTRELRQAGVPAGQVAEPPADAASFDAAALWDTLRVRHDWRGAEALIVRGESGRDALALALAGAGATVTTLAAYRRGAPPLPDSAAATLREALAAPTGHLWFFSASAAIERLAALTEMSDRVVAAALATHPQIAATARAQGFGRVIEARPAPDAVIACLQSFRP